MLLLLENCSFRLDLSAASLCCRYASAFPFLSSCIGRVVSSAVCFLVASQKPRVLEDQQPRSMYQVLVKLLLHTQQNLHTVSVGGFPSLTATYFMFRVVVAVGLARVNTAPLSERPSRHSLSIGRFSKVCEDSVGLLIFCDLIFLALVDVG